MTAQEFTDWQAYFALEPWGSWRDNWHAANTQALLYNINRGKQPSVDVADFMFKDEGQRAQEQAAAFRARLEMMVAKNA